MGRIEQERRTSGGLFHQRGLQCQWRCIRSCPVSCCCCRERQAWLGSLQAMLAGVAVFVLAGDALGTTCPLPPWLGPSSSSIGRASRWALRGLLAGLLPEAQHLHGDAALPGARRVCACQPHVPPTLGMVAPLCPLQGAESEVLGCVVVLEAQHSAQLCLSVTALEALVVGLFSWRWLSESEGVPAPPVSHSKHCCWVPLGHRNHGAHLGTTWEPVL